jgi:hypothetical protein
MTFEVGKAYRLRFEDAPGYEGSSSEEDSSYTGVCTLSKRRYAVFENDNGHCIEVFLHTSCNCNDGRWWDEDLTWFIQSSEVVELSEVYTIQ